MGTGGRTVGHLCRRCLNQPGRCRVSVNQHEAVVTTPYRYIIGFLSLSLCVCVCVCNIENRSPMIRAGTHPHLPRTVPVYPPRPTRSAFYPQTCPLLDDKLCGCSTHEPLLSGQSFIDICSRTLSNTFLITVTLHFLIGMQ